MQSPENGSGSTCDGIIRADLSEDIDGNEDLSEDLSEDIDGLPGWFG